MLVQQINDSERVARLKSRELAESNTRETSEMPGLAEHRQLSINLPQIHVDRFKKEDGSVQRWKHPTSSRRN